MNARRGARVATNNDPYWYSHFWHWFLHGDRPPKARKYTAADHAADTARMEANWVVLENGDQKSRLTGLTLPADMASQPACLWLGHQMRGWVGDDNWVCKRCTVCGVTTK